MSNKLILSPTFLTYTLGCRVNQAEISAISFQLLAFSFRGFDSKIDPFPQLILINTCAVTQKAERESRKAIHHFKRIYPKAKAIALGCGAKFIKDSDLVIENQDKANTVKIIFQKFPCLHPKLTPITPRRWPNGLLRGEHLQEDPFSKSGRALVKIQEGCNNFCAYCIVPYLRGKPKSEQPGKIISEINRLTGQGIKEIILCGINLSLYGQDLNQKLNLTALLKKILKETPAERISLSSIEPEYLYNDHELADLFIKELRLSKYFHLALQSGSPNTLKAMGRRTDLGKLIKILRFIKEKCPEFTFRADVITGFPTETEKNFKETLDFIKKAPITFCHVFPFSIRQGTAAEKMIKVKQWRDFPSSVKKERAKKVVELAQKIQREEAEKLIGKVLPCLVLRKVPGGYEAIADNSWSVKISHQPSAISSQTLIGQVLPVKIINLNGKFLRGEVIYPPSQKTTVVRPWMSGLCSRNGYFGGVGNAHLLLRRISLRRRRRRYHGRQPVELH